MRPRGTILSAGRIALLVSLSLAPSYSYGANMNTYEATIKVGSGYVKQTIQSDNDSHAKQLFEQLYGKGNVMNVHQKTGK